MKQNQSFLLQEIAGVSYILPYGQMIADHRRGLKTNATGAYLWSLLEEEHSLEEVLSLSAAYYEISETELPDFQKDITQFINQLLAYGILIETVSKTNASPAWASEAFSAPAYSSDALLPDDPIPAEQLLSIGGLNLKLVGPADAFPPDLADFVISGATLIHQTIYLYSNMPPETSLGQAVLRNRELVIWEQEEQYLLHFPSAKSSLVIYLSKDAATVHCYCRPPYEEKFHYDLFHALRLVYLYLAQKHNMAALHSASILYRDKLWLFSGHSGMGKSTHTNLWKEHFGSPVINGDLNLLAIENGTPVVHGIPWCGTSEIYDTKTYPLGGIILLNKAKENTIEHLPLDQKQLLVSQRLISPSWTKELWNKNLELVEQITEHVLVCRLHCTKDFTAAEIMKQEIDEYIN